jgi:pimeloyl-ACP methyl ester carboxylesterase
MATYVLVAGAWLGGWAWKSVARSLRARGHEVYPATLTGLGDRVHLARPEVDLETHITDVIKLIETEDLAEVVLVGHSYAGSVVTGVGDRRGERLSALVYCDSGPLADGQSVLDLSSPEGQAATRQRVAEQGEGWRLPFPGFEHLATTSSLTGLGPAERDLMQRKAIAQPFATFTQPLRLRGGGAPSTFRRAMILCEDGRRMGQLLRGRLEGDWLELNLETGHWPMLSLPEELGGLLDQLGG